MNRSLWTLRVFEGVFGDSIPRAAVWADTPGGSPDTPKRILPRRTAVVPPLFVIMASRYHDPRRLADALAQLPPWGALLPSSNGTHSVHVRPLGCNGIHQVRLKFENDDALNEDARILRDAFRASRPPPAFRAGAAFRADRPVARSQVMLDVDEDESEGKPLWDFNLLKDYQQDQNLRRITATLNAARRIEVCPSCREQPCDPLQGACCDCAARGFAIVGVRAHGGPGGTIASMAAAVFKDKTPAQLEAATPGAAACCVCRVGRELALAFDCGHVSCGVCAQRWDEHACPICRVRVTDCTRLFAAAPDDDHGSKRSRV